MVGSSWLMLRGKPMHAYALILEIGAKCKKQVSLGLIYPALQEREARGLASSTVVEGKKVFSITRAGTDCPEQNREIVGRLEWSTQEWSEN